MRSRLSLFTPFMIVFAGCGAGHRSVVAPPTQISSGARPESAADALSINGDSSGLAKLINATCNRNAQRGDCYEAHLVPSASAGRVKLAMGALNELGRIDPDVRRNGHVYAHAIGIAAGKGMTDIAATFTQCSESFQSGCYHGVIQAWFGGLDSLSAKDANALCAPFRSSEASRWIRFQCVHGMGHGLTMLYDHDLPKGLAGCDLLADWWDRHSCYSGAFMENIVNVTNPHHPASSLAHHDGGMHDMEGMDHDHARAFKAVDPADQLYPCTIMAERYLIACYEMQTSVMLHNNKGDIAAAARSCDTAPKPMRTICYASLGRDVSSYSAQNHSEGIRMCSLGTPLYQPWCYYGLVKNFIDLEARPEDGLSLCRDVASPRDKAVCYAAVGEQILVLASTDEKRRAMCLASEPDYRGACLYGARVGTAPAVLVQVWESIK